MMGIKKIIAPAFLAASLCAVAFAASGERMIYLNLRMVEGRISLEQASVVPGRAKVPRFPETAYQDIRYKVETGSGEVWLTGEIEDPSMVRVESEDGSGFQVANKDTVRFVLRLPFRPRLGAMSFFRWHPGSGDLGKASANGDFIGGFSLSGVGE